MFDTTTPTRGTAIDYTQLGRTGVQVSWLCLGTMNLGPQTSEPDTFAIMDHALEAGFNFFDTANRYGGSLGVGATEQIIGRSLAQGGRRENIVLATKVFGALGDGPSEQAQKTIAQHRAKLEAYEGLCRDLGEQLADVALAWLLHNPVVTAPIIGPRRLEQLTGSLRAVESRLTDETLAQLDQIWLGPGGEAPKAYA